MQANTKKPKKTGPLSIPSCRLRKGYNQAIVTLRDAQTQRAKDYWLGESGIDLVNQFQSQPRRLA